MTVRNAIPDIFCKLGGNLQQNCVTPRDKHLLLETSEFPGLFRVCVCVSVCVCVFVCMCTRARVTRSCSFGAATVHAEQSPPTEPISSRLVATFFSLLCAKADQKQSKNERPPTNLLKVDSIVRGSLRGFSREGWCVCGWMVKSHPKLPSLAAKLGLMYA